MTEEPPRTVFALRFDLGGSTPDDAGPEPAQAIGGSAPEAPRQPLLAVRPPQRTLREPGPDVLTDVESLLAAVGLTAAPESTMGEGTRPAAVPLVVVLTTPAGTRATATLDSPVVMGRHPQHPIPVLHALVSRQHCVVTVTDDGARLTDLGSTNGTWIRRNDHRIGLVANQPLPVEHDDWIFCEELAIAHVALVGGAR